jgi:hypothetical protein
LRHAGDLLDDIVEAGQVLHVDRRDHVDPGVEDLVYVLPTLFVSAAGDVRVRELVDQHHGRLAFEDRVEVHLLERLAAVLHRVARNDREVTELGDRLRPPVGLDVADDHIGAALEAPPALVEHGERLPYAGRGAQVDTQLPSRHREPLFSFPACRARG